MACIVMGLHSAVLIGLPIVIAILPIMIVILIILSRIIILEIGLIGLQCVITVVLIGLIELLPIVAEGPTIEPMRREIRLMITGLIPSSQFTQRGSHSRLL